MFKSGFRAMKTALSALCLILVVSGTAHAGLFDLDGARALIMVEAMDKAKAACADKKEPRECARDFLVQKFGMTDEVISDMFKGADPDMVRWLYSR